MAFGENEFYEIFHKPEVLPYIVGCAGLEPCRKLTTEEMQAIAQSAGDASAQASRDAADRAEEALNSVNTILQDVRRALSIATSAQDTAERAMQMIQQCQADCSAAREAFESRITDLVNNAISAAENASADARSSRDTLERALDLIRAFTCSCNKGTTVRDIYNVNSDGASCLGSICDGSCNCTGCSATIVPDGTTETAQVTAGCCGGLNITYNENTNTCECCSTNTGTENTGTESGDSDGEQ